MKRVSFATESREALAMALTAIGAHKLRSSLTLLGILIGVFSIVVVMTAIRALQRNIEKEMTQLGSHTFAVQRFPAIMVDDDLEAHEKYFRRKRFRIDTAEKVKDRAQLPKNVGMMSGFDNGVVVSRYAKSSPSVELLGASPEGFETRNWTVAEGRALTQGDLESARQVCVLGASVAKSVFPHGSALGESVRFSGASYQVVGVLETKGALFGQDMDSFLVVPITTGLNRYGRNNSVSIQVQAFDQASYDDTLEEVRGLLRTIRKVPPGEEDDFEIVSNDSIINQFRTFTLAIRAGAGVISSIALLAAGIGIMNIMLVSVTERTKEIGVRRAIGAKKRNIMTQFIMEAVVLSEIGGLGGVVLGILSGNLVAMFLNTPPVIPVDWIIIGLGVCSFVGILFGTYPAWKAANLDPIESLRYE